MSATCSLIVSEVDTVEQAESYDRWLRAKVEASLAEPGQGVPHYEVMAQMDAIIDQAENERNS